MKQELWINGLKADIKDDSLILFTFQQSDYSNPTAIKNSYTKSVTLPGTPNNNKIFNDIYRFDYNQAGNTFNPSKRAQFNIYSNGTLLESGYVKLSKITGDGDYHEYQINLYGGIGDFMYSLQHDAEGNKLTMADIILSDYFDLEFTMNKESVANAWLRVNGDTTQSSNWDYINFAPCYNGVPDCDGFDPTKVAVYAGYYGTYSDPINFDVWMNGEHKTSVPSYATENSVKYYPYAATNVSPAFGIFTSSTELTEWQVNDHRCWLQRPVFSVKLLITAIQLYLREIVSPQFSIKLDETWFNDQNPYWANLWITLPMLYQNDASIGTGSIVSTETLFGNTKTPYEYLTCYTKSFGLWYDYDTTTYTVTIKPRCQFYKDDIIDISGKIDMSDVKITPLTFSNRTIKYSWAEAEDNISEAYNKAKGESYGTYGIDTGYMFDSSSKTVPDNQIIKSAVDTRDTGLDYTTLQLVYGTTGRSYEIVPWWMWGNDLSYTLFDRDNLENTYTFENVMPYPATSKTAVLTRPYVSSTGGITGQLYTDGVAKPWFSSSDNSSADGADVFLLYTGTAPKEVYYKYSGDTTYDVASTINYQYITDDIVGIGNVTGGKQVWLSTTPRLSLLNLPYIKTCIMPKFQRMNITGKTVLYSLDFGKPAQTYVYSDLVYDVSKTVSRQTFLDKYLGDLYDINTRLVETKLQINDPKQAMHSVYYFGGSYWVINKIVDFTYDSNLTTVQFIKVNSIDSYIRMFDVDDTSISVPVGTSSNRITYTGGADLSFVTSKTDVSWITPVVNKTTGELYIYVTETNSTGSARTGNVWFSYNTITRNIKVTQAAS